MPKHNFKELNVWKKSISLTEEIYLFTASLPNEEKFGLISQMRRSAVSIPSNIAEGSGRDSDKEFSRFLDISLSSAFELETQIIIAQKIFSVISEDLEKINQILAEVQNMIYGLKKILNLNNK